MKKIDCWIITKNVEYPHGEPSTSYPVRICENETFAKELMQTVYDDANKNRWTKFGTYSDPIWLNDETLQVKCTCRIGWMTYQTTETYHITPCDNDYLFSKQIWIND